jgi:hypothetical protein
VHLAALCCALSPALIGVSREVSEIPLFALVLVLSIGALVLADREPGRTPCVLVALAHFLALATYYLGPLVLGAIWLGRMASRQSTSRRVGHAALAGVALGAPFSALALRALWLDLGARAAAALHPDRAWGESTVLGLGQALARETLDTVGPLVVVMAVVALRSRAARPAVVAALATLVSLALLAPIVRVQPYQALVVAPLMLLSLARFDPDEWPTRGRIVGALIAVVCVVPIASAFPAIATLHTVDADAVFARYVVAARLLNVERIVAVADYDSTLLAYEAASASHTRIDSTVLDPDDEGTLAIETTPRIAFLTRSHDGTPHAAQRAVARLRAFTERGAIAVVARDTFPIPEVDRILDRCAPLDASPTTRLVLCERDATR